MSHCSLEQQAVRYPVVYKVKLVCGSKMVWPIEGTIVTRLRMCMMLMYCFVPLVCPEDYGTFSINPFVLSIKMPLLADGDYFI